MSVLTAVYDSITLVQLPCMDCVSATLSFIATIICIATDQYQPCTLYSVQRE